MPEQRQDAQIRAETEREHFERLLAERKIEEVDQYLQALALFVKLDTGGLPEGYGS